MVFDVGNVLINWDVYALFRRFFPDDSAVGAFLEETGLLVRNIEFDRGEPFAEGLADLTRAYPHHAEALAAFDERWIETVTGAIPGTADIVDELLGAGATCHAITNFSAEKWPVAQMHYPVLGRFGTVIVSGAERLVKPDPAIWHVFLERTGLDPAECIFTDDTPANVESARALGVDAILFTGAENLRAALRERGMPLSANPVSPARA